MKRLLIRSILMSVEAWTTFRLWGEWECTDSLSPPCVICRLGSSSPNDQSRSLWGWYKTNCQTIYGMSTRACHYENASKLASTRSSSNARKIQNSAWNSISWLSNTTMRTEVLWVLRGHLELNYRWRLTTRRNKRSRLFRKSMTNVRLRPRNLRRNPPWRPKEIPRSVSPLEMSSLTTVPRASQTAFPTLPARNREGVAKLSQSLTSITKTQVPTQITGARETRGITIQDLLKLFLTMV